MRVLIIKTSSMGDVIHTLPALTDASRAFPNIQFDWIIEENFAEIPRWHPRVQEIIPISLRRWRKNPFAKNNLTQWRKFREILRSKQYDFVIDAQGLLFKSAWLTLMAKGIRCGFSWQSAREPLSTLFYQKRIDVGKIKETHAVTRMRKLLSGVLGYPLPDTEAQYGIERKFFLASRDLSQKYVVFLHGTTWATKHWPEVYWTALAKLIAQQGYTIKMPWGNTAEFERAERIAKQCKQVTVLPRMKLAEIAAVLAGAKAAVSVDTGLGHLAAALAIPTVSLYGPSNPLLTGTMGHHQIHLSAQFMCSPCFGETCTYRGPVHAQQATIRPPCFSTVTPPKVFMQLMKFLKN